MHLTFGYCTHQSSTQVGPGVVMPCDKCGRGCDHVRLLPTYSMELREEGRLATCSYVELHVVDESIRWYSFYSSSRCFCLGYV
jgi:hypothetical protein